ncbi:MAG TPA: pteridine reductase [Xanthomonadales bacterium]
MQSTRRTALITGAARRIGACIAETLHQRGCDVFLHYHSSSVSVTELAHRLNALRPSSAIIVQADLGETEEINGLAGQVRAHTGRLDLLVNNASRFYPTTVGDTSMGQWNDLMDSNLRGPYFLTQALLPELTLAGGSVVNLLDVHAAKPMPGHAVYCMAKAGLQMMTLALAKDLGPQIRVNGVAPGAILWPELESSSAAQKKILDKTVMGRAGHPEDIASAVVYLGLDAPYVTGQVLAVDGGRSLNI